MFDPELTERAQGPQVAPPARTGGTKPRKKEAAAARLLSLLGR